jgi:PAS domain S-box-containing protein
MPPASHILIVEDDPGLALLFGDKLRLDGRTCDVVDSGQACIAWLETQSTDLMLLDYSLPDLVAPALVEQLRQAGRLPPFIVATGHGDERVAVEMMKLGALDYLVKDSRLFDRLPAVVGRTLREVEQQHLLAATQEALRLSEERFKVITCSSPDHLLVQDRDLRYTFVLNPQLGLTEQDMLGKTDHELFPTADANRLTALKRQVLETGQTVKIEVPLVSKSGAIEYFSGSYIPRRGPGGKIDGLIGYFRNITERKRAEETLRRNNRALKAMSECGRIISRSTSEAELLQQICTLLIEQGGYRMAWVGLAKHDEAKSVRPVAHAGFEDGFLDNAAITWADTERGHGPTGTAIRTGTPVIAQDIQTSTAMAPWRADALRRSYATSIALPLIDSDRTCWGALTVYSESHAAFDTEEIALLTDLAGDLSLGVRALHTKAERERAEEQLRQKIAELQRWHDVTLGRETRIQELKREVNELLARSGLPIRYGSQAGKPGPAQAQNMRTQHGYPTVPDRGDPPRRPPRRQRPHRRLGGRAWHPAPTRRPARPHALPHRR